MDDEYYSIIEFDTRIAPDEALEEFFSLLDSLYREVEKEDPFPSNELRKNEFRDPYPFYDIFWWLVRTNQKIIGFGMISFNNKNSPDYSVNKHLARASIKIHKDYRHRGIGTELAKILVKKAENYGNITTIQSNTVQDSGKRFSEKLGGILANESSEKRCKIEEIDWSLMNNWKEKGEELTQKEGIHIDIFQKCPEEIIDEFCKVYTEINNQQPRGNSESRHIVTPEIRRLQEQRYKEKNVEWQTIIARVKKESIIGLTEIIYDPEMSYKIEQELTGVLDNYRGKGLGKWLKAEMLYIILKEYPEVKYIQTGNAVTNDSMISINIKIGFRENQKKTLYKFNINQLKQKLKTL
ncbi:MAG TPA: GNAT family N-acetyltransferase [Candidatus Bathyarchaeia archaeon]|nr:GNAT family N-acetyltransferase [Candidatus Bathyarchaeia archaeon]